MWIKTRWGTLFNTDAFRSIFIEYDNETETYDLEAYEIGTEEEEGEDDFYCFGTYKSMENAQKAVHRLEEAIAFGRHFFQIPEEGDLL